ncbi:MAG TPA: cupin domain-containing protein, partial [Candidatus Limnocylindrales bacterium]|nr:cupin domain-containing protein [Candidatus Limnocylindrales bacterium]
MKGEFALEVGEERFTLRPGDSVFAPRLIPHAWAHVGEGPGTLLLAVELTRFRGHLNTGVEEVSDATNERAVSAG